MFLTLTDSHISIDSCIFSFFALKDSKTSGASAAETLPRSSIPENSILVDRTKGRHSTEPGSLKIKIKLPSSNNSLKQQSNILPNNVMAIDQHKVSLHETQMELVPKTLTSMNPPNWKEPPLQSLHPDTTEVPFIKGKFQTLEPGLTRIF